MHQSLQCIHKPEPDTIVPFILFASNNITSIYSYFGKLNGRRVGLMYIIHILEATRLFIKFSHRYLFRFIAIRYLVIIWNVDQQHKEGT